MGAQSEIFDVVIIGGGPAGATAALESARKGLSVIMIEKDEHPRFHIGESFLPRNQTLLRQLGLLDKFAPLTKVDKFGASFVMGDTYEPTNFFFSPGPHGEENYAFSMERAPFDRMLWDAAREAGATTLNRTAVKSIDTLEEGNVVITTTAGTIRGRLLLDASGQNTVVARHLKTRQPIPNFGKVAFFQHFTNARRREGKLAGSPTMVMCEEGWFWVIPLDPHRTSIGLVTTPEIARKAGADRRRMLQWGIERCPYVRRVVETATTPADNLICADYSFKCEPFAGPGYFLVGDAAMFLDPIFSTGVCMSMMAAIEASKAAFEILRKKASPQPVRDRFCRFVSGSSGVYFRLIRSYYRHGFREMFLHGQGPLMVHKAVLAALAGHVFPKPVWKIRWRLELFFLLLNIHEKRPLVPLRKSFSLFNSQPDPLPSTFVETPEGSTVPAELAGVH